MLRKALSFTLLLTAFALLPLFSHAAADSGTVVQCGTTTQFYQLREKHAGGGFQVLQRGLPSSTNAGAPADARITSQQTNGNCRLNVATGSGSSSQSASLQYSTASNGGYKMMTMADYMTGGKSVPVPKGLGSCRGADAYAAQLQKCSVPVLPAIPAMSCVSQRTDGSSLVIDFRLHPVRGTMEREMTEMRREPAAQSTNGHGITLGKETRKSLGTKPVFAKAAFEGPTCMLSISESASDSAAPLLKLGFSGQARQPAQINDPAQSPKPGYLQNAICTIDGRFAQRLQACQFNNSPAPGGPIVPVRPAMPGPIPFGIPPKGGLVPAPRSGVD